MEETLGKRISKNRKRLGLTQDRLAEMLGVTAQAVSKWENDQSCPDIQMIPKLADIFSITTDELLGKSRTVETTVEPSQDEKGPDVEINLRGGRKTPLSLAVWLLIAGGASLYMSTRNQEIPLWTMIWTSGLMTFGLFGLYPKFSIFRLGCALAGGYFLGSALFELPSLGWPVVLIVLGVLLLIRAMQKQPEKIVSFRPGDRIKVNNKAAKESFRMEEEHFDFESSFSENRKLVTLPKMSSGYAECNFGEMTVDLSGCGEIEDGAEIELQCSFGALNLLVPDRCRLTQGVSRSFGDCRVIGNPRDNADSTIHVAGNVNFGEINIRYI